MVRTGGISYKINPTAKMGSRISDIVLTKTNEKLDASKSYKVAGWSTVGAKVRVNQFGKQLKLT